MELTKKHLFKVIKMCAKLDILADLKSSDNRMQAILNKVLNSVELIENDIDEILSDCFPHKDIKNVGAMEYIALINHVYEENKNFFMAAHGALTSQKN